MSANEAVLYRTHILNPMICREIERLRSEVAYCDQFVVGYLKGNAAVLGPPDKTHRIYRRGDLVDLPYPNKTIFVDWSRPVGDNDLPVLAFYREQPGYDFYWIVEYDVRYTGHWGTLFGELRSSDADYLGTTIQDYDENPRWVWWHTLVNAPTGLLQRVRCFTPFSRLSNRALSSIDQWYRDGGAGHYEMTWPSVCQDTGSAHRGYRRPRPLHPGALAGTTLLEHTAQPDPVARHLRVPPPVQGRLDPHAGPEIWRRPDALAPHQGLNGR